MKKRLLITSALLFLTTAPAIAEWQYGPPTRTYPVSAYCAACDSEGSTFMIGAIAGIFIGIMVGVMIQANSSQPASEAPPPRPVPLELKTAPSKEHYDRLRMRALAQAAMLDAEAELYQSMLRTRSAEVRLPPPGGTRPGPKPRG